MELKDKLYSPNSNVKQYMQNILTCSKRTDILWTNVLKMNLHNLSWLINVILYYGAVDFSDGQRNVMSSQK
jgi:hypothetical protein